MFRFFVFLFFFVLNLHFIIKRVLLFSEKAGLAPVVFSRECSDRSGSLSVLLGDISSISIKHMSRVLAC